VIGFSPASSRESILVYKKKNHYNEWEFTYDPLQDQKLMQGGNTTNSGINGQPAGSSSSTFGSVWGRERYWKWKRHWQRERIGSGTGIPALGAPRRPHRSLNNRSSAADLNYPETQKARPLMEGRAFARACARFSLGASARLNAEREPQPQVDLTWGFSNLKPAASSVSNRNRRAAVEIHQARWRRQDFESSKAEDLVHHAALISQRPWNIESRAAAANHADA